MIRERNGRLDVVVYLGRDPVTGRERKCSQTVQGTDAAARARAAELEVEIGAKKRGRGTAAGFRAMYGYDTLQRLDWHPAGTLVYRIMEHDVVLYVGVTGNLFKRMGDHHKRPEFQAATHVEWELYPDRELALTVEAGLIADLRPIYNIRGIAL